MGDLDQLLQQSLRFQEAKPWQGENVQTLANGIVVQPLLVSFCDGIQHWLNAFQTGEVTMGSLPAWHGCEVVQRNRKHRQNNHVEEGGENKRWHVGCISEVAIELLLL